MSRSLVHSLWITAVALLAFAVTACGGGDDDDDDRDAGATAAARLVILDPPGDAIGLPPGGGAALRVRYETLDGEPIAGEEVDFAFISGPTESAAGSSLSDTTSITDTAGIARVDVAAGAERTNFRIRATAPGAQPVTFYVAISELGFTNLIVRPTHEGWRDPNSFVRVQLRLFRRENVTCGDIDIDDPPESVFPPRTMAGFDGTSTFQNLSALEPYTLIAWGELLEDGARIAFGCVTLGANQVQPGRRVSIEAVISDRPLAMPTASALSSSIDLTPIAEAVRATGASRPWDVLACPAGPGQLLLDCALDAAITTAGDPDDCVLDVVAAGDALAVAIEAQRAPADEFGCRPASQLDQTVAVAVTGGPWPTGAALAQLLGARDAVSSSVEIDSELVMTAPDIARHRLVQAEFDADPGLHIAPLIETARPVVVREQVPVTVDPAAGQVAIGEHGFSLRIGSASYDAFVALGLTPAGLDDRTADLGAALVESLVDGGDTGCTALSALVCGTAGEPAGCLDAGCAAASDSLDDRFHDWWQLADGAEVDFTLTGIAPLYDFDDDLQIDTIGADQTGDPTGTWSIVFTLADGRTIATVGIFGDAGPSFE